MKVLEAVILGPYRCQSCQSLIELEAEDVPNLEFLSSRMGINWHFDCPVCKRYMGWNDLVSREPDP